MSDQYVQEFYPAAAECREAVFLLAEEISRRTDLQMTVTESDAADFVTQAAGGAPLRVEVHASHAGQDLPEGFLLVEDEPRGGSAPGGPHGSLAGHYLRTMEAVSRNSAAARSVVEKLGQLTA
jgi:hypothetical protein